MKQAALYRHTKLEGILSLCNRCLKCADGFRKIRDIIAFDQDSVKLNLEITPGSYLIHSYSAHQISIALQTEPGTPRAQQETLTGSFILTPRELIREWAPQTFDELTAPNFTTLAMLAPEIVILGCGARQRFPHPSLTTSLHERNIGLEVMDTGAACRTYNILLAEGRNVLAALLMP